MQMCDEGQQMMDQADKMKKEGSEELYQAFQGRGKANYDHGQALQKQADELKKKGVQMCDEGQQMMDAAEKMKKK